MRQTPILVVSLVFATACGPSFEPRQLRGHFPWVRIQSYDFEPGDVVSAGGVSATVGPEPDATFDFALNVPAESLGVGEHTLTVTVDRGGSVGSRSLEVKVLPQQLEPYLRIGPCPQPAIGEKDAVPVTMASDVWVEGASFDTVSNKPVRCRVGADATVRVMANADATVTIAGASVPLDGGVGSWTLDRDSLVHALPLKELQGRGDASFEIPAVLTRPGAEPVEHALRATLDGFALQLALEDGLRAATPGKPVAYPRSEHEGPPRGLILVTAPVKATVAGEAKEARPRGYGGVRTLGPDDLTADAVDRFAVATPTDVTLGGSCSFDRGSGLGVIGNRIVRFGLDVVVVDAAGAEVARRSFATADKVDCPASIAGEPGETVVITSGPDRSEVYGWLEAVRTGGP